jgi:argininosuccinate lyase
MKLWKGRFLKAENSLAEEFNASIEIDQRLYKQDITGSIAHAKMLAKQGILSEDEALAIESSLLEILRDIEAGRIEFTIEQEDIHMNIESILTERIGAAGKKLHTARSRNDQVAVDIRLYLKEEIQTIKSLLSELTDALTEIAKVNQDTVMPGYTHLQRAQPVTLAYHLLAYREMFRRDMRRFKNCYDGTDSLPLGSGALAGTTYNTDRDYLAEELDFSKVCINAMDAVSDRDFALEFLSCCSIAMMHLSRFCEELILWSSAEFRFIEIDDAFSTGSSIMPQKKNPDMAELIRGKTGRVYGDLMTLLTIMKGLPLAYNKDMQEDKAPVFDAGDTLKSSLKIFTQMITTMRINTEVMENAAKTGFMNATDAADYLVTKGLAFRDCHEIIGRIVLYCIEHKKSIEELSLEELKTFSDKFEADIYDKIDIRACINAKKSKGSTSFESVEQMLKS